jgi:hypothetical protein
LVFLVLLTVLNFLLVEYSRLFLLLSFHHHLEILLFPYLYLGPSS